MFSFLERVPTNDCSQSGHKRNTMAEQRKAVIKNADMSEEMQQDAVDIASQALSKYNIEKVSEISLSLSQFADFYFCGDSALFIECHAKV